MRGGLDLGGTKVQAVVVDDAHEVRGQARRPTPVSGGPDDIVAELVAAMRDAAQAAGVETAELSGVGVGSPGAVDTVAGTVREASNLPGWGGEYPLAQALAKQLGTKVVVGNDVQAAVGAEFVLGAGRDFSSLLGVFWGSGVGGGIILDGKPWLGRGASGEIGHMVVKRNGARCPCGRRGCVEAYAGRVAMEARAKKLVKQGKHTDLFKIEEHRGRTRLTSGVWERALERGDAMAVALVDRAVEALGTGIASAQNLLDVETVVIGGGLGTRLGQPYVERIEKAMMPHLFTSDRPPAMRLAALGDLGGAIGASLLVAESDFKPAPLFVRRSPARRTPERGASRHSG
jgi:glucokinase